MNLARICGATTQLEAFFFIDPGDAVFTRGCRGCPLGSLRSSSWRQVNFETSRFLCLIGGNRSLNDLFGRRKIAVGESSESQ